MNFGAISPAHALKPIVFAMAIATVLMAKMKKIAVRHKKYFALLSRGMSYG